MTANDIIKYLETWAPPGAAWERDNVGLQVGSRETKLKNIMICLELTSEVLQEALSKKCNFIFTHHPLIFNPIKKLDIQKDLHSKLIEQIIKQNITVYSAHTNLDFTKNGVSFELAETLGLRNIKFLENEEANQFKVAVFVPAENLDSLAESVFSAGAGIIGEYENCSFRLNGEGTFKGSANTKPYIGRKQKFEKAEEVRLEFIVDSWNLHKVISAMISSHPYEEPAYDIYPLKNKNVNFGEGAIGLLESEKSEKEFLDFVSKKLKADSLRYTPGNRKKIKKVAVCGGAGSALLNKAISAGADAYITSDIKYHTFHDAINNILLIDAGHYETEAVILNAVKRKIEKNISVKNGVRIYRYSKSTNPIKFYKHKGETNIVR